MAALACGCWLAAAASPAAQTQNFDDLARRASEALDTDPRQAIALYDQALALRPDWADGWLYRGASLFQLDRLPEARDSFRKGVALAPRKGTPFAFLGIVEYELGDYPAALADILKGEAVGLPDKPDFIREVYYHAALLYLRSANFGQALEQLRSLAKRGIQSDSVVAALGLSALGLNYPPSAIPADRQALVNLAGRAAWQFLAERLNEAAPLFQQLRNRFPNEPGVHYMTGVFLLNRDREDAKREFRNELRIAPAHILARIQLAELLTKDGDAAEAVRLAEEAARLAPSDPLCQVTLGKTLFDAGQTAQAIAALEKGEKLAPQVAKTHFYLLQAYRRAGRAADARQEKAQWERLHVAQDPAALN